MLPADGGERPGTRAWWRSMISTILPTIEYRSISRPQRLARSDVEKGMMERFMSLQSTWHESQALIAAYGQKQAQAPFGSLHLCVDEQSFQTDADAVS